MHKRIVSINETCSMRGLVFNPSQFGDDVVLSVKYTRRLPDGTGRRQAIDKRAVVFRDGLKAALHSAQMYNAQLHILLSRRDPVDVARSMGFHPNLLSALSNGVRVDTPPYYQLYTYRGSHGQETVQANRQTEAVN